MEWWTPQRMDWYIRASQCSEFHERLACEVARLVPNGKTILEVGCGLGYMTRALSKKGYSIEGIDNDENAISKAIELSGDTDLFAVDDYTTTERKANIVLAVFCGRIDEEGLGFFERIADERVIYIVSQHRYSSIRQDRSLGISNYLKKTGYHFTKKELYLRFDQPFESLKDAESFFEIQHGNTGLEAKPSNGPYPYIFENEKKMSLFDIHLGGRK